MARRIYRDFVAKFGRFLPNYGNFPYIFLPTKRLRRTMARYLGQPLRNRKLVFCINSGRVGSGYLATLLANADKVTAFHEPRPRMTGQFLRAVESKPMHESYDARLVKIIGICRSLQRIPADHTYAETSHMFIKTFHDVVVDFFDNVHIVVLRREICATVKSMVELGYFSEKSHHWKIWMRSRQHARSVIQEPHPFKELDPIDRAICYLLEVEGRAEEFVRKNKSIHVIEVWLEDIATVSGATELFAKLEISINREQISGLTERTNSRDELKVTGGATNPVAFYRERVRKYVKNLSEDDQVKIKGLISRVA